MGRRAGDRVDLYVAAEGGLALGMEPDSGGGRVVGVEPGRELAEQAGAGGIGFGIVAEQALAHILVGTGGSQGAPQGGGRQGGEILLIPGETVVLPLALAIVADRALLVIGALDLGFVEGFLLSIADMEWRDAFYGAANSDAVVMVGLGHDFRRPFGRSGLMMISP